MVGAEISRRYRTFPPEVEDREDKSRWIHDFSGCIGFYPDFMGAFEDKRPEKRIPYYSRLCDTFISYNAQVLDCYRIIARTYADRRDVLLTLETQNIIGAFPLRSPATGQWKHYMMIHPRQGWDDFGLMLSAMGMKKVPMLENLPLHQYSSRDIPTWVIASIIITRIEDLFKDLARKFQFTREYLSTPKGRIKWVEYITKQLPKMKVLQIPCDCSVIEDHKELMSFIRYTLDKIQEDLLNVKLAAPVVAQLLVRIGRLMRNVAQYIPMRPPVGRISPLLFGKNSPSIGFANGLEAIEWTNEDRGLAGDNEFAGLSWSLDVNEFFEAYVETIAEKITLLTGGMLKIGRNFETSIDIEWENDPGIAQRHLRPDFVIERDDETIILDAKYKGYWHLLDRHAWLHGESNEMKIARDSFRDDILQVLAYSTCFKSDKIKVCLVYPCTLAEYENLRDRGELHQKAFVGERNVEVVRTLVPMSGDVDTPAHELSEYLLADAS